MLPFKNMIKNLTALKNGGVNEIIKSLVILEDEFAKNLNRSQLIDGENINGTSIEPAYTRFTVSEKKRKGQIFDRVTLKDTGDFHKSFTVKASSDSFVINATDPKTNKIQRKYGDKILGLSEENKALFGLRGLQRQLIQQIKKKI
jgi:hypothetical protein